MEFSLRFQLRVNSKIEVRTGYLSGSPELGFSIRPSKRLVVSKISKLSRKLPNLKVVPTLGGAESAQGVSGYSFNSFEMLALTELGALEADRVSNLVHRIVPTGAIIGVGVTPRSWDIRPVLAVSSEEGASLIRFLGPEVTLSVSLNARVKDLLEREASVRDLSSRILGWGILDGQLWYRRELVERTLQDDVSEGGLSLELILPLALSIAKELSHFHSHGIVHGHLTPNNIAVDYSGKVTLLDAGIGVSVVQASSLLGVRDFPAGYVRGTFAPESATGESVSYSADIYSVGKIIRELFSHIESGGKKSLADGDLLHLGVSFEMLDLIAQMTQADPTKRPNLGAVIHRLEEELRPRGETPEPQKGAPQISQGKLIRTARGIPAVTIEAARSKQPEIAIAAPESPTHAEKPRTERTLIREAIRNAGILSPKKLWEEGDVTDAFSETAPDTSSVTTPGTTRATIAETSAIFAESAEGNDEISQGEPEVDEPVVVSGKISPVFYAGAALLLVLLYFYRTQWSTPTFSSPEEMGLAWSSMRPSSMIPVAESAIDEEHPDKIAETLIVRSVIAGDKLPSGVDIELIRTAFDDRWEAELSKDDRRVALTLALRGLLKGKAPQDPPALSTLHPGVLLAILASSGEGATKVFKGVPLDSLTRLPAPIGIAFQELTRSSPELDCGSEDVRLLAALATDAAIAPEDLFAFLRSNTERNLKSLAVLVAIDDERSGVVLNTLLNHPNLQLDNPFIDWGKTWNLSSWDELGNGEKLLLLSGFPPTKPLETNKIAVMFAHPAPAARSFAISQAVNRIKFLHPGAMTVLTLLKSSPELVTAKGTLELAQILEAPEKVTIEKARKFLASEPPLNVVEELLKASAKEKSPTRLDFELVRFLQSHGWSPTIETLTLLATHPERLTRFASYTRIFELSDKKAAAMILTHALRSEKDPQFIEQLKVMLKGLALG